jgi:hypothetical protein
MPTKYTYSISNDFPNGAVALTPLTREIHDSSITIMLDYVNVSADDCDLWFKADLSSGEQSTLEGIVASHAGVDDPDAEGTLAKREEDDFLWVAVNNFPRGTRQQLTGYGDDITNGVRGAGQRMYLSGDTVGDHYVDWQFQDLRYLIGGTCEANADAVDDEDVVSFSLRAPSTASTSTPGTGNCNAVEVVPSSGMHIYVPDEAGEGDVTVDLESTLNANVGFTAAVPVPNASKQGWFNYNVVSNVLTPNYLRRGAYDLYDFETPLGHFLHKVPVLRSAMSLQVTNIVSTPILPHWVYRVTYSRAAASAFTIRWWLATGSYDIRVQ